MARNRDSEVELTRGLGIGIGVFIALFAVAIAAFATHPAQKPGSPVPRQAQRDGARAPLAGAPVDVARRPSSDR